MLLTKSIPVLSVAEFRFKLGMWLPLISSGELRVREAEVEKQECSASLPSHNLNVDAMPAGDIVVQVASEMEALGQGR